MSMTNDILGFGDVFVDNTGGQGQGQGLGLLPNGAGQTKRLKMQPDQSSKSGRYSQFITVVISASILSLVLATLSISLNVWLWIALDGLGLSPVDASEAGKYEEGRDAARICLPCSVLREAVVREKKGERLESSLENWFDVEGGGSTVEEPDENGGGREKMCCADGARQLADLLNKVLHQETADKMREEVSSNHAYLSCIESVNGTQRCIRLHPSSSSSSSSPVAAHLVSDLNSPQPGSDASRSRSRSSPEFSRWASENRLSFCRGGVECTSSHLLPTQQGLYYVYSQVTYRSALALWPRNSFTHTIKRYNEQYPNGGVDLIMQHTSTTTPTTAGQQQQQQQQQESSFIGGLVRIISGDRLYVEVSDVELVRTRPASTFFGMFKLS